MMRFFRTGSRNAWLACLCLLGAPVVLCADRIDSGGTSLQRVKIVDLDGSRIAYRTPSGELRFLPITEVDSIYVDSVGSLSDLNEAERLAGGGGFGQAVVYYERAIRLAPAFWARLVRARLIQACDQADRIDTLVMHFAAILDDEATGAPLAAVLLPERAPVENTRGVERALRRVNEKIDAVVSQSGRVVLEMLRYLIVSRTQRGIAGQYAKELVRQPVPLMIASRAVYRVRSAALERWMADGNVEAGLRELDADLLSAPHGVLPESLLIKARALLASAADEESLIRAGWVAMRIVIHYPDDQLVPEALLVAAEVHERIGRVPTALQLLDECIGHPRISAELSKKAVARIDRLRALSP